MKLLKDFREHPHKYRIIYFEVGIIIALLLVLYSFNYRTYEVSYTAPEPRFVDGPNEEFVDPTTHDKPKPQPPEPRINIQVVDNDTHTEDNLIIEALADDNTPLDWVPEDFPDEIIIEEVPPPIYIAEEQPQFPGGNEALFKYMFENTEYPNLARELGISGTVYIEFVVETDGSLSNFVIKRSVGGGCDKEAIRVLKSMPNWSPGLQNGRPVRVKLTMPVNFALI